MLAQLEGIDGVIEARVDWTGRRFLFRISRSVPPEAVIAAVAEVLGPTVHRLSPTAEQDQLSTFVEGAPWLRSGETTRLSAHEAKVLAARYATTAAERVGRDDGRSARLRSITEEKLSVLFKRFEQSGLPSRDQLMAHWSDLIDRVMARSREFLSDDARKRITAVMKELFGLPCGA